MATSDSAVRDPAQAAELPALPTKAPESFLDRAAKGTFLACSLLVVLLIFGILWFLARRGVGAFVPMADNTGRTVPLTELLSTDWAPSSDRFGALPFLAGSLVVTGFSMLLAGPFGILLAAFATRMAPSWGRTVLRQAMDLLVGIPSVVFGLFGLTVLLPALSHGWLQDSPASGFLAAALILAVMVMPTVVSLSMDAFEALPRSLDEGAQGLGATVWQSLWQVQIPAARPRLFTAVVLGMGRALGEAMAVQMVIGNNPQWIALMREATDKTPFLRVLFTPASTLTTELVQELPNTPVGSTWNNLLFAMGFGLYLLTMLLILVTRRASRAEVVK